jgi:uncharacterized protein (DUF362 family)
MSAADKIAPYAHLLGQVPDRIVAEKAGISRTTVVKLRRNRGIAAFHPSSAGRVAQAARKQTLMAQRREVEPVTFPATSSTEQKRNQPGQRPAHQTGLPQASEDSCRPANDRTTQATDGSGAMTRVACCQGESGKLTLLANALNQAGFWDCLDTTLQETGVEPEDFSILITPDFACLDPSTPTGTDPALVEGVIDLLGDRGYTNIAMGASPDSSGQWLENRDVMVVADMVGYRFMTNAGYSYDVVDLSEDLVSVPFPEDSVLHGTELARPWVGAHFRINFPKNKTHEEFFYALGLHNLLNVLPLANKQFHYRVRLKPWDVALAVLQQTPPQFTIIDAIVSSHGQAGGQVPHPLDTQTIIAGQHPLLTDWVGAIKMGLDPFASRINGKALATLGLPEPHHIIGDLTPYEHWENVHPLWAALVQRVNESPALSQVMNLGKLSVNRELFPFKGEVGDRLNALLAPLYQRMNQNPAAFWGALGLQSTGAATLQSLDIWRTLFFKQDLRWQQVSLDLDLTDYNLADYEAVVGYIESLEDLIESTPPDPNGLRWRYLEGSILFNFSRVLDAPFGDFVDRVDISRSIQYMKDYIGGCCVPIARDPGGRVTHQAERNLYLPQPNYLVLYGGKPIDVAKLEFIRYGEAQHKIFWQTVKSSNGSAEFDDGSVTFSPVGPKQTRVTIVARQKFTLPLFWQAVNLDLSPTIKKVLVSDAYSTYFNGTLNNFEAAFEGRPFRIGQPWWDESQEGDPENAPEQVLTDFAARTLHQVDHLASRLTQREWVKRVWQRGPEPTVDAEGFSHFEPPAQAANKPQPPYRQQATKALKSFGAIAGEFLTELGQAVRKDLDPNSRHD